MRRLFPRALVSALWVIGQAGAIAPPTVAQPPIPSQTVDCELLVVGGGLAGVATAYEALLAGRTVCLTEITDWVGGQLSSQGTAALDESSKQRSLLFYSRGYNELRQRIADTYGTLNPGDCWVSLSCFLPKDGHRILWAQLQTAAKQGHGTLKWFPATVIKDLEMGANGERITGAIAIQHHPTAATLNRKPLSRTIEDAYRYENSPQFKKTVLRLVPQIVIDATETGELVALADVPYRLGLDPRTYRDPSAPDTVGDPYCTQGFTYTFAMEQTAQPQPQRQPSFYAEYEPYYGYDSNEAVANFDAVFTYRRIWSPQPRATAKVPRFGISMPKPGDISMQNWVWGNDYRPGTASDNLIYTRDQLQALGQLAPGGWRGGLRTQTLRHGEEIAQGFYYWLVAGTSNSQPAGSKRPYPNHQLLKGLESPMGTAHGLSKYPYIRESRRIIGRPAYGYPEGFSIAEIDISRQDYRSEEYRSLLSAQMYRDLWTALSGLNAASVIRNSTPPDQVMRRSRSTIYPDSVGISQYAIDFHPCMAESPPEKPGNIERPGTRIGHGAAYPGQIPLRAMIPQRVNNLLVAGKSIAASHVAAAAYRTHAFEWSVGAAAGTTADFVLAHDLLPYQLVDDLPRAEPQLAALQRQLKQNGNPTEFPNTSIFNLNWQDW